MPFGDGTGPMGNGSQTGWGMGPCGAGPAYGRRGLARGRGYGLRRFWGYNSAPTSKKEETSVLSEEADILEQELKAIKSRLAELKNQK